MQNSQNKDNSQNKEISLFLTILIYRVAVHPERVPIHGLLLLPRDNHWCSDLSAPVKQQMREQFCKSHIASSWAFSVSMGNIQYAIQVYSTLSPPSNCVFVLLFMVSACVLMFWFVFAYQCMVVNDISYMLHTSIWF